MLDRWIEIMKTLRATPIALRALVAEVDHLAQVARLL
jgi:hypothetical protein